MLQSILIGPAGPSVAAGLNQQLTASAHYSDGTSRDVTGTAAWTSSNTATATVASGGLVTGVSTGTATITATFGGVSGSATLTVNPPNVVSMVITPATMSIAPGTAFQFTATGTFTDSSTKNVTATAQWSSSDTSIAGMNLNGAPGLAGGLVPGTVTVTANIGTVSATASLTVTSATLTTIAITPSSPSLPLGTLLQLTATGTFSDGTSQDISNTVTWSSSNTNVATITVSGVATARNLGTTTITAASGAVSSSVSATVNASNISSLAVTPANPSIAPTTSVQLSAIGTFNDGSTHDLTNQATWSSSDTTIATIGSHNGVAKGVATGLATITATVGSSSANAALTVTNATVVSIAVTPTGQTIPPATKQPFTATGAFSDSSSQVITRDVVWASDNTAVATISNGGTATGIASGTANISATLNGVTGSAPLTVNSATLTSISVLPQTGVLAPGSTLFYGATGTYSDGSTRAITNAVQWNSSATNVATISASGLATGQSPGTATITATQGGIIGSAALVVNSSPLVSVQVTPSSATIAMQTSTKFQAFGSFADGSAQNLTSSAVWTSSPSSVATVSTSSANAGQATGVAPGTATITALFAGQVGTASLKVTNATLTSISIAPTSPSISLGSSVQFAATGHFSDGSTQTLTSQVSWSSSNVNVAAINTAGVASSVATGTTTITASMLGVTSTTVLTVF